MTSLASTQNFEIAYSLNTVDSMASPGLKKYNGVESGRGMGMGRPDPSSLGVESGMGLCPKQIFI